MAERIRGELYSTLRDELPVQDPISTLLEAEVLSEQYQRRYNEYYPHSALAYKTPAAFAAQCKLNEIDAR